MGKSIVEALPEGSGASPSPLPSPSSSSSSNSSNVGGGGGGGGYGGQQERLLLRPPSFMKAACRKRQRFGYMNFMNSCGRHAAGGGATTFFNSVGANPAANKCAVSPARFKGPLLPPLSPDEQAKKTLVLDLDETLVHSSFKPISDFDFAIQVDMEVEPNRMGLQTVFVLKRPGVEEFLRAMASLFEVVVFTAGLKQYADAVLDNVDIENCIKYRLYRDSCKFHMGGLVKDLSTLGRDLRKVIIVDNSPHCYLLQPRNAVPIASFIDNRDDHELLDLIPFLSVIAELDNVTDALGQM